MKTILSILLITISLAYGSGNHSASGEVELKKWSAVKEFHELDGFKLRKRAIKNLGIEFEKVKGSGPWSVPVSSLIQIKHSTGVYRRWNGWITMVLVKVIKKEDGLAQIKSIDLQDQDEIAIAGVTFLRMTDADLNADTVDACSH